MSPCITVGDFDQLSSTLDDSDCGVVAAGRLAGVEAAGDSVGIFWFVELDWFTLLTISLEIPPVTKSAISVATTQATAPPIGNERPLLFPTMAAVIPITASKNPMTEMGIANRPKNGIQQKTHALIPKTSDAIPSGLTPRFISTPTFLGRLLI
jgi:hypothetical protein